MSTTGFVKSATTSTPVQKTQADMMAILMRYGAEGFGFRKSGDVITATFHLVHDTVEMPINLVTVRERLSDTLKAQRKNSRTTAEQVERVAWRVLYLWIDAALSAVSLGVQTIEEAFFAHIIVRSDDGNSGRMVDYIANVRTVSGRTLPSPFRQLGAGTEA